MQKSYSVIQVGDKIIVNFPATGETFEKEGITKEEKEQIFSALNSNDEDAFMNLFFPERVKAEKEQKEVKSLLEKIDKSTLLKKRGDAVYIPSISELSVPKELILAIIKAEEEEDKDKLTAYKNFWTLMSLNTDSRCRENLFWYLNKWGMKIAKCGFFVGYRNVDRTKDADVFTDHYTHSFKIKIGEMVTMNREDCDSVQEHQCSRGLHLSQIGWLKDGYCGQVGIACLCNPADVVCVPYNSDYGKLRTCAYLPIALVDYDNNGDVIPLNVDDGFDCKYITKVIYEGLQGTEEESHYKIKIPDSVEYNTQKIKENIFNIAFECITNKVIK